MAKDIEEILTRSELKSRAICSVAMDGYWGPVFHREGKDKANRLLEEAIKQEEKSIASRPGVAVLDDNSLPGYGVSYENLSCFRGTGEEKFDINIKILRQIWHGLNFVEIPEQNKGVPHKMLSAMNTSEILSLYRSFARLVEYNNIPLPEGTEMPKEVLKRMPAEEAVSKMVGYGCRHQSLSDMRSRGWTGFPTGRGDLIKRIKALDRRTKDSFMALLDSKKRTTELTAGQREFYDFNDPCFDGYDARRGLLKFKGRSGKEKYCRAIHYFMDNLYKRNAIQEE